MISLKKPKGFKPEFSIVSCICLHNNKMLLLFRSKGRRQESTWGVPAGKIEDGETKEGAMLRELFEETGIHAKKEELKFFKTVYVSYPDYDFIHHMFSFSLNKKPAVKIREEEHLEERWISLNEALRMPLVADLDECLKLFFGRI